MGKRKKEDIRLRCSHLLRIGSAETSLGSKTSFLPGCGADEVAHMASSTLPSAGSTSTTQTGSALLSRAGTTTCGCSEALKSTGKGLNTDTVARARGED